MEEDNIREETGTEEREEFSTERGAGKRTPGRWAFFLLGIVFTIAAIGVLTYAAGLGRLIVGDQWKYYSGLRERFGKYNEVMEMIDEDPIARTTADEITEQDIRDAIAATGDPYAQYFTADEYRVFMNSFTGSYVGVGIAVVQEGDNVVVRVVYNNGSAADAGMEPGDIIVKVDGEPAGNVDDAVSRITGKPGTQVTVTVKRGDKELDFTMDRVKLDMETVASYKIEDAEGVGYIAISSFAKNTAKDFKLAVEDLQEKGCDKFIIDLRNNGGGITDSSIEIADYLLPACVIMTDVYKNGKETVYNSKESSADLDFVMLVNENTASASEILSGAIQDNHAAKIIGTRTFGKGVTQAIHKFEDGSAVKITISEYFRPNGDTVNGEGITPDIEADSENIMDIALEELGQ